jgi:hypothetical protein
LVRAATVGVSEYDSIGVGAGRSGVEALELVISTGDELQGAGHAGSHHYDKRYQYLKETFHLMFPYELFSVRGRRGLSPAGPCLAYWAVNVITFE